MDILVFLVVDIKLISINYKPFFLVTFREEFIYVCTVQVAPDTHTSAEVRGKKMPERKVASTILKLYFFYLKTIVSNLVIIQYCLNWICGCLPTRFTKPIL